ncbi:MAG: hypothetical protein U0869_08255 [Chloroflexota bacterium]
MRDRWFGRAMARRLPGLLAGLVIVGAAIGLMARAGLGLSPWETFHQGISVRTGLPMGTVSILLGIPILLLWIPLRARPGIGTLINIVLVGLVTNWVLSVVPPATWLPEQALLFGLAIVGNAIGAGLYLAADLGAGPRDGLFTALHHRTGVRIAWIRSAIELGVLAAGWAMGATVGVGTIIFAIAIGRLTEWSLGIFDKEGRVMRRRAAAEDAIPEGAA